MATWYDLTFIYKQLLTYQQMTKLDGNLDALAEGAAGAPKIQVAAVDDNQITADKLGHGIDGVSIGFDADKLDGSHLAGISGIATVYGTYTGDDTRERGITHGLGRTPELVLITAIVAGHFFRIIRYEAFIYYQHQNSGGRLSWAGLHSAVFWVGDPANYTLSANANGIDYVWVAIG